jgi:sugar (pentulose or hexulose) kinase
MPTDLLPALAGSELRALSLSAQGGTTIPVDAAGQPTHLAFSWMDERAGEEACQAEKALGRAGIRANRAAQKDAGGQ